MSRARFILTSLHFSLVKIECFSWKACHLQRRIEKNKCMNKTCQNCANGSRDIIQMFDSILWRCVSSSFSRWNGGVRSPVADRNLPQWEEWGNVQSARCRQHGWCLLHAGHSHGSLPHHLCLRASVLLETQILFHRGLLRHTRSSFLHQSGEYLPSQVITGVCRRVRVCLCDWLDMLWRRLFTVVHHQVLRSVR